MKEELCLDHFEERSWQGLHPQALITMIAYVFLQHRWLAAARRARMNPHAATSANFAWRAPTPISNSPVDYRCSNTAYSKLDLQQAAARVNLLK
jgi:hypothetical protein